VPAALAAYRCLEPYNEDKQQYGLATRFMPTSCENEVIDLLVALQRRAATDGSPSRQGSGSPTTSPGQQEHRRENRGHDLR
jgi:hypothetical protein